LAGSELLIARQVQRLEQGMGRATRSNDDHCVVFLLGKRLAERLYGVEARACFSPATRAQIELSEQVADQVDGSDVDVLRQVALQCLDRDADWVRISRATLAPLRYGAANVSEVAVHSRRAFDHAAAGDFSAALDEAQSAVDATKGDAERGYMLQQYASYEHHVNPSRAQQTQRSANRINRNVLRPMDGVAYERLAAPTLEQGVAASGYLQTRYLTGNELLVGMNALVADLVWGPRTDAFEQAWADLADHLGFAGQQPERDTGRGPDDLWALPGGAFHVAEAKSEVNPIHPVYKKHAEQLSNSMDWFRQEYGVNAKATPILIHPRSMFDKKAAIPTGCRVVTEGKLTALRDAVHKLAIGLADSDTFRDAAGVGRLLASINLTGAEILNRYTVPAAQQH
jgi:hypothetical protein